MSRKRPLKIRVLSAFFLFIAVLTVLIAFSAPGQQADQPSAQSSTTSVPAAQARILDSYGKLPLSFEANQGQADARVKFLSRTSGYSLFLARDEAVLALRGSKADTNKAKIVTTAPTLQSGMAAPKAGDVLRMKLRNANPAAKVTGADELAGTSNYFIGNDPAKWRTNIPTYAKVKYEGIYSGIDLVYYGNQRQLEYDFIVAPGADPHRIQFDVRGAKRIRRDEHGDLVLKMGGGEIRWHTWCDFPTTPGAFQTTCAPIVDREYEAFVSKINPSGSALVYSTYLTGSNGGEEANYGVAGIAVDSAGNAYVTGYTASTDFPVTPGAFQTKFGGGGYDAYVSKLNPTGSALVYSTYLGGGSYDKGYGIAVDSAGNAYVAGGTASADFPTKNPFQPTLGGSFNAFVAKINSTGSALVYSTYLGGSSEWGDMAYGIAVDAAGHAYVTGYTDSTDFPTTTNADQPANAGQYDAFFTKLDPTGSSLLYSSYLGGSGLEDYVDGALAGIALDRAGNAYVTGNTQSTDFPTMNPWQAANGGGFDVFISKFSFGIGPPTNIDQCKKDGWKVFTIPEKFKNQGDCVSFVNTGK